jgi:ribosomal protein S18 acetylase RimI-like enzyme
MFVDDNVYGFVAEASKAVVGCARCIHARAEERFYLTSLYVLPRFQQRGIGARLLNEAEQQAEACGYDRVWLGVMEKNTIACAWYKKIGFTFVEEAPFTMGTTTVQHVIGYKPIARCQTQENLLSRSHKE